MRETSGRCTNQSQVSLRLSVRYIARARETLYVHCASDCVHPNSARVRSKPEVGGSPHIVDKPETIQKRAWGRSVANSSKPTSGQRQILLAENHPWDPVSAFG